MYMYMYRKECGEMVWKATSASPSMALSVSRLESHRKFVEYGGHNCESSESIQYFSVNELETVLREAWAEIPVSVYQRLVASMPRRCAAVIKKKGYPTLVPNIEVKLVF